jgi:hypothetical protein
MSYLAKAGSGDGMLRPGKNVIAIVATPIPKQHEWENGNG